MPILQFAEDRSDREMEWFVRDNMAARRFCGFGATERTPDRSCFGAFPQAPRNRGPDDLFKVMRTAMKEAGLIREILAFVDASKLESKMNVRASETAF